MTRKPRALALVTPEHRAIRIGATVTDYSLDLLGFDVAFHALKQTHSISLILNDCSHLH